MQLPEPDIYFSLSDRDYLSDFHELFNSEDSLSESSLSLDCESSEKSFSQDELKIDQVSFNSCPIL
jgi:hypothetical protein